MDYVKPIADNTGLLLQLMDRVKDIRNAPLVHALQSNHFLIQQGLLHLETENAKQGFRIRELEAEILNIKAAHAKSVADIQASDAAAIAQLESKFSKKVCTREEMAILARLSKAGELWPHPIAFQIADDLSIERERAVWLLGRMAEAGTISQTSYIPPSFVITQKGREILFSSQEMRIEIIDQGKMGEPPETFL